jgi:glycine C-acetyltransferase
MDLLKKIDKELYELRKQGLYRSMRLVRGAQSGRVIMDGREVLLLCSNDYLGLTDHPAMKEAAILAVERYGTGSGASRLVSGNMEPHVELEGRIASFKGTQAALLFNSGYGANTGIIPALAGRGDIVFSDRLNHASIVDGALLSRARLVRYPHNDFIALRRVMADTESSGRSLIVSDGVFSMDGDLARLAELVAIKGEFGALLMVDDAHGTGVLGESGRGSGEICRVMDEIDIHMGTFGKALGSFGAYAAASREIIDYLVNRARSFMFSTALPPAVSSASIAALNLVDSGEGRVLRKRLEENASLFRSSLQNYGFNTMGSETQIIPLFIGEAAPTIEFSRQLFEEGIFVQGIRPPTVPAGSCRLRCTVMATHTVEELSWAADVMAKIGKRLGII